MTSPQRIQRLLLIMAQSAQTQIEQRPGAGRIAWARTEPGCVPGPRSLEPAVGYTRLVINKSGEEHEHQTDAGIHPGCAPVVCG